MLCQEEKLRSACIKYIAKLHKISVISKNTLNSVFYAEARAFQAAGQKAL